MTWLADGIKIATEKRDRAIALAHNEFDNQIKRLRELAGELGISGKNAETEKRPSERATPVERPTTSTAAIRAAITHMPHEFTRSQLRKYIEDHYDQSNLQEFASCFIKMRATGRGFDEAGELNGNGEALFVKKGNGDLDRHGHGG
jgi:hypothetical protein